MQFLSYAVKWNRPLVIGAFQYLLLTALAAVWHKYVLSTVSGVAFSTMCRKISGQLDMPELVCTSAEGLLHALDIKGNIKVWFKIKSYTGSHILIFDGAKLTLHAVARRANCSISSRYTLFISDCCAEFTNTLPATVVVGQWEWGSLKIAIFQPTTNISQITE